MKKAVRLDKFLADAGAGTRSEVKKFIQKGKVQVNGVPAKKSEIKVSEEDEVVLDGNRISQAPEFVYYLLHKPAGYVSATEDKRDKTVMELVASDRKGLFPVGRLDKDTEGLLLITDDGALAHELLSPKKHVDKTYYAVTDGCMTKEDVQRFADGLEIGEKNPTPAARALCPIASSENLGSRLSQPFISSLMITAILTTNSNCSSFFSGENCSSSGFLSQPILQVSFAHLRAFSNSA